MTLDLVVLVSGSGTNLQAILDAIAGKRLDARLHLVLSNKPGVKALDRARAAGIATQVLSHKDFANRQAYDVELVRVLRAALGDSKHACVVLAGFMRILTTIFLDAFPGRVINIHPSLLPSFPGVNAQQQAVSHGVRISGCTVHLVDAGTDTGRILAQAAVPVLASDDEHTLGARILEQEHQLLPAVLQSIAEGKLVLPESH
ncbi:MAG: phosphoribosylglycinamide formyltransferase [Polyangiales bacterium]